MYKLINTTNKNMKKNINSIFDLVIVETSKDNYHLRAYGDNSFVTSRIKETYNLANKYYVVTENSEYIFKKVGEKD